MKAEAKRLHLRVAPSTESRLRSLKVSWDRVNALNHAIVTSDYTQYPKIRPTQESFITDTERLGQIKARISEEIKPTLRGKRQVFIRELRAKIGTIERLAKRGYVAQESANVSPHYFQDIVDATKLDEDEECVLERLPATSFPDNNKVLPFSAQRVLASSHTWQNLGHVVLSRVAEQRTEDIPRDLMAFVKPFLPADLVVHLHSALDGPQAEQVRKALVERIIDGVRDRIAKKRLAFSEQDVAALEVALFIHFGSLPSESFTPQGQDKKIETLDEPQKTSEKKKTGVAQAKRPNLSPRR